MVGDERNGEDDFAAETRTSRNCMVESEPEVGGVTLRVEALEERL